MVFGRKDPTCPRCQELLNGSPAREGWQKAYYSQKAKDEAQGSRFMQEHFTSEAHSKEIVCTAFDY